MKMLEAIHRALRNEVVEGLRLEIPPPVARLLGIEVVGIEEGKSTFRIQARRDTHANPMGTLHGGILCDLADAAMGMACASLLDLGESFTTVELKINYFRPVVEGLLEARARVVHAGKTTVYLECDVVALPQEKLVAKAGSTCMVLRGEQAKGR
ncbi:MAG TPA: PaaI family thioesterase [Planctomycetota bacterium]|nr:PaaI family thioesterase [Planctomycetota bacterium]